MIRYYRLFDLLNRRGMKKSDLRAILSPKTIAKLSKGENVETNVIDKICIYLHCQPSDIMEVVEVVDEINENTNIISKQTIFTEEMPDGIEPIESEEIFIESTPKGMDINESDEEGFTNRQYIATDEK